MHDLVKAASHALSQQDAETLERLLAEASTRVHTPAVVNMEELTRASTVLTAQVRAAERHLGVSPQSFAGRSYPWEL